jgi:hypothetical protein
MNDKQMFYTELGNAVSKYNFEMAEIEKRLKQIKKDLNDKGFEIDKKKIDELIQKGWKIFLYYVNNDVGEISTFANKDTEQLYFFSPTLELDMKLFNKSYREIDDEFEDFIETLEDMEDRQNCTIFYSFDIPMENIDKYIGDVNIAKKLKNFELV